METFEITIEGCWKEEDAGLLPEYTGVFFVFEAKLAYGRVSPLRLLYVGSAENVREGILSFAAQFEQMKFVRSGNMLCYQAAPVEKEVCERVMAAFIYIQKPPANERYKYKFPFATTQVISRGNTGFLKEKFTI